MGYTLVEIMIVVVIIAILSVIAIPNFLQNRKDAHRNSCLANQKQIVDTIEQIRMKGLTPTSGGTDTGEAAIATYVKSYDALSCPAQAGSRYCTDGVISVNAGGYTVKCPADIHPQYASE